MTHILEKLSSKTDRPWIDGLLSEIHLLNEFAEAGQLQDSDSDSPFRIRSVPSLTQNYAASGSSYGTSGSYDKGGGYGKGVAYSYDDDGYGDDVYGHR